MSQQTNVQRGFTLIELIVVVALTAILLILVAPSFIDQMGRRQIEGAATELTSDLQFARSQAVDGGSSATTVLTTSANGYTVTSATTMGGLTTFKTVSLGPGLSITNPVTVTFDGLRGMANASNMTLQSTKTSAQLTASVSAMGRVSICSLDGSLKGYNTSC